MIIEIPYFCKLHFGDKNKMLYNINCTRFFNFLKEPLLYSENNLESIKTASIQIANLLLFLIGLLGIHFLLKKTQNFKRKMCVSVKWQKLNS